MHFGARQVQLSKRLSGRTGDTSHLFETPVRIYLGEDQAIRNVAFMQKQESHVELSDTQRATLEMLVDRYRADHRPVKRKSLADELECHRGTMSARMGELQAMQIVESISGRKGGYKPRSKAYDVLTDGYSEDTVDMSILGEDRSDETVRIEEIALTGIHDPDQYRGEISINNALAEFNLRDRISIGPLQPHGVNIEGIIIEQDRDKNVFAIEIEAMDSPSK